MIIRLITFGILFFGLSFFAQAKENNFFNEGKKLFDQEKYEDSKFLFERSIVYNTKHSNSYLDLGKIIKIVRINH